MREARSGLVLHARIPPRFDVEDVAGAVRLSPPAPAFSDSKTTEGCRGDSPGKRSTIAWRSTLPVLPVEEKGTSCGSASRGGALSRPPIPANWSNSRARSPASSPHQRFLPAAAAWRSRALNPSPHAPSFEGQGGGYRSLELGEAAEHLAIASGPSVPAILALQGGSASMAIRLRPVTFDPAPPQVRSARSSVELLNIRTLPPTASLHSAEAHRETTPPPPTGPCTAKTLSRSAPNNSIPSLGKRSHRERHKAPPPETVSYSGSARAGRPHPPNSRACPHNDGR